MIQKLTFILLFLLFPVLLVAQINPSSVRGISGGIEQKQNVKPEIIVNSQNTLQKAMGFKMPVTATDKFYVNWHDLILERYISHLQVNPAVTNLIRGGVLGVEELYDGTMDANGNWWAINVLNTFIYRIDKTTGALHSVAAPASVLCRGIAFNPQDGLIYFINQVTGNTVDLYSLDPDSDVIQLIRTYTDLRLWGLACSNDGVLYSLNDLIGTFPIVCIDPHTPGNTVLGNSLDDNCWARNYVDMEFDSKTNKLYMITQNFILPGIPAQLREVTLSGTGAGSTNLIYDFEGHEFIQGMAFDFGIVITRPTLSEIVYTNNTFQLKWIGGGAFNINLDFSTNGGVSWTGIASNIASTNTGYDWEVPQTPSTNCLIRATRTDNPSAIFYSSTFEIRTPFQILIGNNGENWLVNSEQTITWYQNIGNQITSAFPDKNVAKPLPPDNEYVSVAYSINGMEGPWTIIATLMSCNFLLNSLLVALPSYITDRGLFRIMSETYGAGKKAANGYYDPYLAYSTHYFSLFQILNNGKLVITSPNGGETYKGSSFQTIQWRRKGIIIGSMLLEYSTNNGQTWTRINNTPVSNVSKYNWIVPNVNSPNCLVKISNYITRDIYDVSDHTFTITPSTSQSESVNFPNPFNPSTRIVFGLDKSSFTSLKVYNSIGQEVAELVNRQLEAGTHEFEFNASKLPSGVYYYNLTRDGNSEIHKMLLLK